MWVQPLSPPARRGRKLPVPASCQEGHVSSLGTLPALVLLGTHRGHLICVAVHSSQAPWRLLSFP